MKKEILFFVFTLLSIVVFSQRKTTEKYELYLINIVENEVNISKGMYMTKNKQYYYEGTIEVVHMDNGEEKEFNFFFSSWDDKYKEFMIKDKSFNIIKPVLAFNDKATANFKTANGNKSIRLDDNSTIDNSILSSMIIWLDNR